MCNTNQKPMVTIEYKQECRTNYVPKCHNEVDYVTRRDCHIENKEECYTVPKVECKDVEKTKTKTVYEDKCKQVDEQDVTSKQWSTTTEETP